MVTLLTDPFFTLLAVEKILAAKIAVKVANLLVTCVRRSRAKLFPRNSRNFVRCIFLVVRVYGLLKLKRDRNLH